MKILIGVALASAAVMSNVVVFAPTAHAASCGYTKYTSYSEDYARASDYTGGCFYVGARHYYDPVWSGNNYWTAWYYGAHYAQTPRTAELVYGNFTGS